MKNYTLYHHIVYNSPIKKINKIIASNGYKPADKPEEAVSKLKAIVRKKGDDALGEMAMIHPDRELLKQSFINEYSEMSGGNCPVCASVNGESEKEKSKEEEYSNICACKHCASGKCDRKYNAEGDKDESENEKIKKSWFPSFIKDNAAPIIFVGAIVYIVSKITSQKN